MKISHKLILAAGSVAVGIIAIFSYIIIDTQHKQLISQIEHSAHQLSETVKSSTRYAMMMNQRESVHQIIDTIARQEGIEKVRVFNKEGAIIYSSGKKEVGSMVDKRAEACYACHAADQPLEKLPIPERTRIFEVKDDLKNLGIINPIYNETGCWQGSCHAHKAEQKVLGVLDITMSLEKVDRQIRANQIEMVIFAISAIFGIGIILWFFIQKLVGKPVSQLVTATNRVAAGNLDYKIKGLKNDELGHLGNSFNEMIRELGDVQRQLYQSEKLASLGRLAAGVAHEINNPLTGVLTFSSFLLKRADKDDETKKDLDVIVRETQRCREIVKGLLDFARQAPVKKSDIDINDVINRALSIVDNQLSINNIFVEKNLKSGLSTIRADGNQIQQVFINLFVNAADAIGRQGGTIFITTDLVDIEGKQYLEIIVKDTGCGLSREDASKIFEPFYSSKGHMGTGLGLAVVWGIINKHGGSIDVESDVGQGTTFRLHLPTTQDDLSAVLINEKFNG